MENEFARFCQEEWDKDICAVKWFAQELIDCSYDAPANKFLMKMESEYRAAFRTIIGYTDHDGNYIPGYLDKDVPFWTNVEEAVVSCMNLYLEAAARHPKSSFYPAVVDACNTILEYLAAGLPM